MLIVVASAWGAGEGPWPILPICCREGWRLTHTPSPPPSPQWYPEVNHFCKEVPIILVGCKTDLRKDKSLVKKLRKNKLEPVTYHRVGNPAQGWGGARRGNLWDALIQPSLSAARSGCESG